MRLWIKCVRRLLAGLGKVPERQLFEVDRLFGRVDESALGAKKEQWEEALARVFEDRDFLDYLFYQANADKERIFRGASKSALIRGARWRTLSLVYTMHRAFLEQRAKQAETRVEQARWRRLAERLRIYYNKLTFIA